MAEIDLLSCRALLNLQYTMDVALEDRTMIKGTIALSIAGTIIALQLQLFDTVMAQVNEIESMMDWGVQTATTYGSVGYNNLGYGSVGY